MTQKVETKQKQVQMPGAFLTWQCEERKAMFDALQSGEMPRFMASHLPVVSTLNGPQGAFPIHSSTKGVGLFPAECHLAEHIAEIDDCLGRWLDGTLPLAPHLVGKGSVVRDQSLGERIEVALSLYGRPERIDTGTFGGIEIFQGQTYQNLRLDPRASLLFTGLGPQYISYQFNCEVELLGPEDPRFRFLRGIRLLFDMERFHLQQPEYPLGYVYRIREVFNKTPHVVHGGKSRIHDCPVSGTGVHATGLRQHLPDQLSATLWR